MTPKWPSMAAYCDAARARGCQVEIGETTRHQRQFTVIVIRAPAGATVSEIVGEIDDPAMSTTIARLDRRLGLKSHLFR